MVAGGVPMIEDEDFSTTAYDSDSDNDGWFDSARAFEARLEARVDNGYWGVKAPFLTPVDNDKFRQNAGKKETRKRRERIGAERPAARYPGLKKNTEKQLRLDLPPTPRGCEWRRSDEGLNLWRYWTEWDGDRNQRIKKSRYAGHLSDDAWRIMKEYDHEAFISIVGERLRRYSGR